MDLPEPERINYVNGIIESLNNTIQLIINTKGLINQKKLVDQFLTELNEENKGPIIMTALIYSIKPEFRKNYIGILKTLSGIREEVKIP